MVSSRESRHLIFFPGETEVHNSAESSCAN
jgi:hypothetical protein